MTDTPAYKQPGDILTADNYAPGIGPDPGQLPIIKIEPSSRKILDYQGIGYVTPARIQRSSDYFARNPGIWILGSEYVRALRTTGPGQYLTYPTAAHPAGQVVADPANQWVQFKAWREHLARVAHELYAEHPLDHALYLTRTHEGFTLGDPIPEEAHERNRAMTRHARVAIGELWREIHRWAQLDPVSRNWRSVQDSIAARMDHLEGNADVARAWVARMHDNINPREVQTALDAGRRIRFATDATPWGILDEPNTRRVGFVEQVEALANFRHAREFYYTDNGDGSSATYPTFSGGFPDGHYTNYDMHSFGVFHWKHAYHSGLHAIVGVTDAHRDSWAKWCKLNMLASMHAANWLSEASRDKLRANRNADTATLLGTFRDSVRDSSFLFGASNERWWRSGFVLWNATDLTLTRDALPYDISDPNADPLSAPQDASTGDYRVSTHVVVVDRADIDRSDASMRADLQPWARRDFWLAWVDREFAL